MRGAAAAATLRTRPRNSASASAAAASSIPCSLCLSSSRIRQAGPPRAVPHHLRSFSQLPSSLAYPHPSSPSHSRSRRLLARLASSAQPEEAPLSPFPNSSPSSFSLPSARPHNGQAASPSSLPEFGPDNPPPVQIPFNAIEEWLHSPYPTQLVHIRDDLLRKEVFRPKIDGPTHNPQLSDVWHHTALELRGDALASFLAVEVVLHFFAQSSEEVYGVKAKRIGANRHRARTCLITNAHWAVIARQFRIFPEREHGASLIVDSAIATENGRLADNLEAYLYALYLDQGLDVAARWIVPIFLKKLYAEAEAGRIDFKLPPLVRTSLKGDDQVGWIDVVKRIFFGPSSKTKSAEHETAPVRKVYHQGLKLPHWKVACSDGIDCKRNDCYFQHPTPDGEWSVHHAESFSTTRYPAVHSWQDRQDRFRQQVEQLIAERVTTERRALKHELSDAVERRLILAIEKNVDPWIANVKQLQQAQADTAAGSSVRQQLKDVESLLTGMGRENDKRDDALRLHQRIATQEAAALRAAASEAVAKANSVQKETKAMLVDLKAQVSQLNKEGKRTFREMQDRLDALEATGKTAQVTAETTDQDANALGTSAQTLTDRIDALDAQLSALADMQEDTASLLAKSDSFAELAAPPLTTTTGLSVNASQIEGQARPALDVDSKVGATDQLSTQAQLDVIEEQSKPEDRTSEQPEEEPSELQNQTDVAQAEAAASSRLAKKQRKRHRQAVAKAERREADQAVASDVTNMSDGEVVSELAVDVTTLEGGGTSTDCPASTHGIGQIASDPTIGEDINQDMPSEDAWPTEWVERAAASRSDSSPAAPQEVARGVSISAAQPVTSSTPTLGYYASSSAVCLPYRVKPAKSMSRKDGDEDKRLDAPTSAAIDAAASALSVKTTSGRSKPKARAKGKEAMAKAPQVDKTAPHGTEEELAPAALPDEAVARQNTTTVDVAVHDNEEGEPRSTKTPETLQQQQPSDGALDDIGDLEFQSADGTAARQDTSAKDATHPEVNNNAPKEPLVIEAAAVAPATEQLELHPLPTIPKGLTGKKASAARKALGKAKAAANQAKAAALAAARAAAKASGTDMPSTKKSRKQAAQEQRKLQKARNREEGQKKAASVREAKEAEASLEEQKYQSAPLHIEPPPPPQTLAQSAMAWLNSR